uniref:Uncharacterized protein n=1 Tax=Lotharella oceanica TaxID=641309 RepID=A0A7S2X704_9EUKA
MLACRICFSPVHVSERGQGAKPILPGPRTIYFYAAFRKNNNNHPLVRTVHMRADSVVACDVMSNSIAPSFLRASCKLSHQLTATAAAALAAAAGKALHAFDN